MNPFLIRRIRGPVYLLCFAFTALLAQWHVLSFGRSWPLYLLAAGLLRLLEAALPVPALLPGGAPYPLRRSFTGGALLLLVGAFALLITTDVVSMSHFWRTYARWWPLALIVVGLVLLLERIVDRRAGVAVGRQRGGGVGFLVFLLVALGLASHTAHIGALPSWNWDGDWSFNGDGDTEERLVTLQKPMPADGTLLVDNARGDVEIALSSDGQIHVDAHETAHVRRGAGAKDSEGAFSAVRPSLEVNGANARLTVPGRKGAEVRLVVLVPDGVACTVRTHHGDVAASGIKHALTVEGDHGDVTLDSLGGPVHLTMDHGDVRARSVTGDLLLEGRADDVVLSGVKGRTTLQGEFFGNTEIDGAGGPVAFHSKITQLEVQRLRGSLSLDGDDLRLQDAGDGVKLETRSKSVDITGLFGDAVVTDANGDVSVALAEPLGAVSLTNNTGNLTVALPAGAGFTLHGTTGKDDLIESEFPFGQANAGGVKTIAGEQGGGPLISLKTEHGDLTIKRNGTAPAVAARRLRSNAAVPAPVVQ